MAAPLVFAGCKQGEGEVCQVDDDCAEGLECNDNTGKCQSEVQGTVDAAPNRVDAASTPDAAPVDAAPPDATPDDAAPPSDAAPASFRR